MAEAPVKVNVLIAAEELYIKQTMREVLRALGAERIFLAGTGADAVQLLAAPENRVHLVIVNDPLPDQEALTLVATIRQNKPKVLILLVTAKGDPEHIRVAGQSGVSAIVIKPFSRSQIEAKLKVLVQRAGGTPTEIKAG